MKKKQVTPTYMLKKTLNLKIHATDSEEVNEIPILD